MGTSPTYMTWRPSHTGATLGTSASLVTAWQPLSFCFGGVQAGTPCNNLVDPTQTSGQIKELCWQPVLSLVLHNIVGLKCKIYKGQVFFLWSFSVGFCFFNQNSELHCIIKCFVP